MPAVPGTVACDRCSRKRSIRLQGLWSWFFHQAFSRFEESIKERDLVMEQVVEQVGVDIWALISERFAQIKKGLRRLFGCWHLKMSLPFTRGPETYRTCVTCGARRRFDLDQWTIVGGFYYPKNENLALHGRHTLSASYMNMENRSFRK